MATYVLDVNLSSSNNWSVDVSSTSWRHWSTSFFVWATVSNISKISIYIETIVWTPNPLIMNIRASSWWLPTGTSLATKSVSVSGSSWNDFILDSPLNVTWWGEYAVEFVSTTWGGSNYAQWIFSNSWWYWVWYSPDWTSWSSLDANWYWWLKTYYTPVWPANLKTLDTNAKANIKTIDWNPIANVKTLDSIT